MTNPFSFNLTNAKFGLTGQAQRHERYPVGSIVRFWHEEIMGSVYPELSKDRPIIHHGAGGPRRFPATTPKAPWCHAYVLGWRYDGQGKHFYELRCVEHEVPALAHEWDMQTLSLLEQLAIASADSPPHG